MMQWLAETADWWQPLERLGGWAVVAWLVLWGVRRMNQRDDQMTDLLRRHERSLEINEEALTACREGIETLTGIEAEERRIHDIFARNNETMDRKLDVLIEQTRSTT